MNDLMLPPSIDLPAILPVAISLITACLAVILGFSLPRKSVTVVGIVGLLTALVANLSIWGRNITTFEGALRADDFAVGFGAVLLVAGILALLSSLDAPERSETTEPEFTALLLFAVTGTLLLAYAGDLIVLLIGFEIMSLAVYVLSGFQRRNASEEAGMKYFLLGSLASAILIYGIATVFGATGSFNLANIRAAIGSEGFSNLPLAGLGSLLILAGFAFKVSWAPLHQWTPDVYSGAPTLVTQYMSVGIKAAAFAGLLRAFGVAFPELTAWTLPTQVLIAVTMLVGNLAALRQQSLKRMLAYSSVAQAGYIGLAVLANPAQGWPAALYYLAAYTLMNAGAFAVLYLLSRSEAGPTIDSLAGLGARQPWLAAALAVFMLSLAGIPPLAGFMGKYLVLAAAAREGYYGLVVLAAITSAMSLYYYLRPVAVAFFRNSDHATTVRRGTGSRIVVALGVAGVLVLGVLPNLAYSPMSGVAASAVPQENR